MMLLLNQTFNFLKIKMEDNHLWRVRDNSYDKEQYYDERYDQTDEIEEEIRKEIKKAIEPCRAYDLEESDF